jgi:hypothetical protein
MLTHSLTHSLTTHNIHSPTYINLLTLNHYMFKLQQQATHWATRRVSESVEGSHRHYYIHLLEWASERASEWECRREWVMRIHATAAVARAVAQWVSEWVREWVARGCGWVAEWTTGAALPAHGMWVSEWGRELIDLSEWVTVWAFDCVSVWLCEWLCEYDK